MSFRDHITAVHQTLQNVSDDGSQRPLRDRGWSRREILGHLIDSALNNHQRFVRAALDGAYTGPSYQQEAWVAIHGYNGMSWPVLVEHWHCQNELLCEVVDHIPQDRLDVQCSVGNDAPVTLRFLIGDYLRHLDHHVGQIITNRIFGNRIMPSHETD